MWSRFATSEGSGHGARVMGMSVTSQIRRCGSRQDGREIYAHPGPVGRSLSGDDGTEPVIEFYSR